MVTRIRRLVRVVTAIALVLVFAFGGAAGPSQAAAAIPVAGPDAPDAADFTMDIKAVEVLGGPGSADCTQAQEVITVSVGSQVAYCLSFSNTGTTKWMTHTISNERGSLPSISFTVQPGATVQPGWILVREFQTITLNWVWTATDEFGTTLTRNDQTTVNVVGTLYQVFLPFVAGPAEATLTSASGGVQ